MANDAVAERAPFLVARELSKRFGSEWALVRATFSLERGAFATVAGPNGSGKTTLLRCLSTFLAPDHGSATLGGQDIVEHRDAVRRKIGALTHPAGLYGALSARENLELVDEVCGLGRAREIPSVLDRVGLGRRSAPLDELSSGLRQRFSLARLALLRRDLVLLDEPETHLDTQGLNLLLELATEWKAKGAVVLCATHAPERFLGLSDTVIRLEPSVMSVSAS